MGKLVERRVTAKFFDNSQGKLFRPGQTILIDEDLLITKTKGKRKLTPGVAELNSEAFKTAPDGIPTAKPRSTGKTDKNATAKPRADGPNKGKLGNGKPNIPKVDLPLTDADDPNEDIQVEEGGPSRGGSSLLG